MKNILIAITEVMPKDEKGNILDKVLHSDLINAVQKVSPSNVIHDVSGLLCKQKTDEHTKYIWGKGNNDEKFAVEVYQTRLDYLAGFQTACDIINNR